MYEAPAIIGTCINCIAPGSFGATLALILMGRLSWRTQSAENWSQLKAEQC
jgi:hypothetical protein